MNNEDRERGRWFGTGDGRWWEGFTNSGRVILWRPAGKASDWQEAYPSQPFDWEKEASEEES